MYRIIKLLNNNVVIARNQQDKQAVLMGKGIAFQKKRGDLLKEEQAEKVFLLKNEEAQDNFSTLLKDIPLDFIMTTYEIIENAINKHSFPVQEYIYVTLTDHIYLAYQKLNQGSYEEIQLPDLKQLHKQEFAIAMDALKIIQKRLEIQFPDQEITRIALQFINAKGETLFEGNNQDTRAFILEQIKAILQSNGIKRTTENQNYYDRLMIHLNYFLERIENGLTDEKMSPEIVTMLRQTYPKAYEISVQVCELLQNKTKQNLSESECLYFTLHLQRLL